MNAHSKTTSTRFWLVGGSLLITVLLAITMYYRPVFRSPLLARSYDGLYHLSMLKRGIAEGQWQATTGLFWGRLNATYPPGFRYYALGLKAMLHLNQLTTLSRISIGLIMAGVLISYFFVARFVLQSSVLGWLATLLVVFSYYPMRRLSFFLPENLALLWLLLFLAAIHSRWRPWLKYSLGGVLLAAIALTNVLTTTIILAALTLWLSILIWHGRVRDGIHTAIMAAAALVVTLPLLRTDKFWLHYLRLSVLAGAALLLLVAVAKTITRNLQSSTKSWLGSALVLLAIGGLVVPLFFFNGGWLKPWLTSRYWPVVDLSSTVANVFTHNFLVNAERQVSLQPLMTYLTIGGLAVLTWRRQLFDQRFGLVTIIVVLNAAIYLLGPFFGINPSINAPRAMLYLALFAPMLAVFFLHQLQRAWRWSWVTPMIVAVMAITSVPHIIRFVSQAEVRPLPPSVTDYVDTHLKTGQYLLTDGRSFLWLYYRSPRPLAYLFSTPPVAPDQLLADQTGQTLTTNHVQFVLSTPNYQPLTDPADPNRPIPVNLRLVVDDQGFSLYERTSEP
ncbi:MAG: hypothetical protein HYY50_02385 [Candidatus Kerfeldbacteria bacterium]|nr:hypothetical protein [Candidatus Kerfeldbacteria bacterium]